MTHSTRDAPLYVVTGKKYKKLIINKDKTPIEYFLKHIVPNNLNETNLYYKPPKEAQTQTKGEVYTLSSACTYDDLPKTKDKLTDNDLEGNDLFKKAFSKKITELLAVMLNKPELLKNQLDLIGGRNEDIEHQNVQNTKDSLKTLIEKLDNFIKHENVKDIKDFLKKIKEKCEQFDNYSEQELDE